MNFKRINFSVKFADFLPRKTQEARESMVARFPPTITFCGFWGPCSDGKVIVDIRLPKTACLFLLRLNWACAGASVSTAIAKIINFFIGVGF